MKPRNTPNTRKKGFFFRVFRVFRGLVCSVVHVFSGQYLHRQPQGWSNPSYHEESVDKEVYLKSHPSAKCFAHEHQTTAFAQDLMDLESFAESQQS